MRRISYANACADLDEACREVTEKEEIVIINRRRGGNVALISMNELRGLNASVHLLRSPKNAQRLFTVLQRALETKGEGR